MGFPSVTGIVTFFRVTGDLSYPSIRENDILLVGSEKIKVLNVDTLSSRIRVLRAVEGTTGSSHTIGKFIYEVPRKIKVNAGFNTDYNYSLNRQIYFDPSSAVGLGTTAGVGIGTTISFANPGSGITQAFIPSKVFSLKTITLRLEIKLHIPLVLVDLVSLFRMKQTLEWGQLYLMVKLYLLQKYLMI